MSLERKECLNSTGYEFTKIESPENVALEIQSFFINKNVFGTIYVSAEGINVNLAGNKNIVKSIEDLFHKHDLFKNILFKHTYSEKPPFRKLKVKVKPEIISIKKEINNIFNRRIKMTIQQVVAELENIKEQTLNNSKITLDDVIEAIEDVITDCKDNSMDFTFDLEDDYESYERETDFTQLEIS